MVARVERAEEGKGAVKVEEGTVAVVREVVARAAVSRVVVSRVVSRG